MNKFPILPRAEWTPTKKGTVQHVRVFENGKLKAEFDMPPLEEDTYYVEGRVRWCECGSNASIYVEDIYGHGWVCSNCGGLQQLG